MSVTTTSGLCDSTAASRDSRSAQTGDHLDIGLRLEQPPEALPDEKVVVREHDADRHDPSI